MFNRYLALIVALATLMLVVGCTTPYKITQSLDEQLSRPCTVKVTTFNDDLPIETSDKSKPTVDDIQKFRDAIAEQLEKEELFQYADSAQTYEVRGSILEYKRGSGFMRFLIGFGAGNAKILTHLDLYDVRAGRVVFGGDFTGVVSDWTTSGTKMYDRVAKDFAKQLKKQNKNYTQGNAITGKENFTK